MSKFSEFSIDDQWILSHRGKKNKVDPFKPYGYFVEKERTVSGSLEEVTTVFLTNNECPFHCLMCDLWKNATDKPVPDDAIPKQIEYALSKLPPTKHLKLYNGSSFFDNRAISVKSYEKTAWLIRHFETVIVESHPAFINKISLRFQKMIAPQLQVAIGLETVHPEILPKLNKRMDLDNFKRAVNFLTNNDIIARAFILLKPPFMSEEEGIYWAKKSIDFAFKNGVEVVTVIPVRTGNGAMEVLQSMNYFEPPHIESLEKVVEYGIGLNAGLVFADLWDIEQFSICYQCTSLRLERLKKMNHFQIIPEAINCYCSL